MFSCEFYEISKNTFLYRTPPVAASVGYLVDDCSHSESDFIKSWEQNQGDETHTNQLLPSHQVTLYFVEKFENISNKLTMVTKHLTNKFDGSF